MHLSRWCVDKGLWGPFSTSWSSFYQLILPIVSVVFVLLSILSLFKNSREVTSSCDLKMSRNYYSTSSFKSWLQSRIFLQKGFVFLLLSFFYKISWFFSPVAFYILKCVTNETNFPISFFLHFFIYHTYGLESLLINVCKEFARKNLVIIGRAQKTWAAGRRNTNEC